MRISVWKIIDKLEKITRALKVFSFVLVIQAIFYVLTFNDTIFLVMIPFGLISCVLGGMKIAYENILSEQEGELRK